MEDIEKSEEYKKGFQRGFDTAYFRGMFGLDFPQNFHKKVEKELAAAKGKPEYPYVLGVAQGFRYGYDDDLSSLKGVKGAAHEKSQNKRSVQ